jgi:hypothetical protein
MLRQPVIQPRTHALRLFSSLGRQLAREIVPAVLGIGVSPQYEIHNVIESW